MTPVSGNGSGADSSLRITVCTDLAGLKQLRQLWEDLISACADATIFSTWEWLTSWWDAFAGERDLFVLAFSDANGMLVALAPFSRVKKPVAGGIKLTFLEFLGDGSGDSDNLGLLVRPGFEESFTRFLLDYLQTHTANWDISRLRTMNPDARATKALLAGLQSSHWTSYRYERPWTLISLPETWELYLRNLSSKERGKLGTRTRRLENRYKTVYHKCSLVAELPDRLEMLYELHGKRWRERGESGSFVSLERRKFYAQMATRFLEREWLEFWFLELNGKAVSTLFGFRYRDTVYSLQEGYDPEYSGDSVGYVLRGHVLKRLMSEGVRTYDFLEGKDPSKERWAAHVANYVSVEFGRKRTRGGFQLTLLHNAGQAKNWLRKKVPPMTWRVLHELNLRLRRKQPAKTEAST
jgi:CelD/BcsL family acetyltransferase involved in cellulose biosynthesis